MKTMTKRIASVALAAIMALTVLVSALPAKAFAAGKNATLTVQSSNAAFNGKTVKAWKMLDAKANADGSGATYILMTEWEEFFKSFDGMSTLEGDTLSQKAYEYVSALDNSAKKNDFALKAVKWATEKSMAPTKTSAEAVQSGDKYQATFTGLDFGYYVMSPDVAGTNVERDAMLVNVIKTNEDTINLKSVFPTVDKTVSTDLDKVNAEIGKELTFKLTADVPDVSEYTAYQFTFKDTLSKGLTFGKFTKVTIDGKQLSADTDYKAEAGTPDEGTKATSINVKFGTQSGAIYDAKNLFTGKAGKKIVVEYTAYINADAIVGDPILNSATVDYSTSPDGTQTGTSNPDVTHQYTFGFQLKKTDDKGALLAGAEFELRSEKQGAAIRLVKGEDGTYHPKTAADADFVEKVTTDDTGIIKFKGLAAGTYYLVETKAPEGYNKLAKPIEITIADTTTGVNTPSWTVTMTGGGTGTGTEGTYPEIQVQNNKGALLPETGGMGTVIFTVAGIAIIAGGIAWKRSRRAGNNA